jgi:hypothetical protein
MNVCVCCVSSLCVLGEEERKIMNVLVRWMSSLGMLDEQE